MNTGKYSSAVGSTACLSCPAGNTSYVGSTSCSVRPVYVPPVPSNVLLSNVHMYPGDNPLLSSNGLWKFSFSSTGTSISVSSAFTGQVYWSASFGVATKFYVNNCGAFAFNLFTQVYSYNSACNAGCSASAFGLMIMDSGDLAIVDGSGNAVTGTAWCGGIVMDVGTAQDLCAAGRSSSTGAIPCTACTAGNQLFCFSYCLITVLFTKGKFTGSAGSISCTPCVPGIDFFYVQISF